MVLINLNIYIERLNNLSITDSHESKNYIREYNVWISQEVGDIKLKMDVYANLLSDSDLLKVSLEDIYILVNSEKYRGDRLDYTLKRGKVKNIKLRSYMSLVKWRKRYSEDTILYINWLSTEEFQKLRQERI